jgi:hypothetical protein
MFSIVASRVPAGWLICPGLQTEHQDGARECSRGQSCLGESELHASWRSCSVDEDGAAPLDCATCGPEAALS